MIVSRQWLREYVEFDIAQDDWIHRLTMSGLNFDGSEAVGGDLAVNLEVTSNRPDCLSHLGVAREIAAVYGRTLNPPAVAAPARPERGGAPGPDVSIEAAELCFRFTARRIEGVRIAASPAWLVDRLRAAGLASVNNVVDATNFVMLECGQPLHAFDYEKLAGGAIVVRQPRPGETLLAIDHRTYALSPGMCVIADRERAVGLGGVMGGAQTEVGPQTRQVLLEAAHFLPTAIRATARALNLHSPASHRFERGIDPGHLDWASRRCCDLILKLAGGRLLPGASDVGKSQAESPEVELRWSRVERVLGIAIPEKKAAEILESLGFQFSRRSSDLWTLVVPTWRRDVRREIDLIEEIGRVYGYDSVPEDRPVPLIVSRRRREDRLASRIRDTLAAAGLDEAMTSSVVPQRWSDAFSPWTDQPPLRIHQPMAGVLEKASHNVGPVECLRRSLIPSLLEVYRINEHRHDLEVHLFEWARVYLPRAEGLPDEAMKIGILSQRPYAGVKGIIECLLATLNPRVRLEHVPFDHPLLDANESGALQIDGQRFGFLGEVSEAGRQQFGFRRPVCVAELDVARLDAVAVLIPQHQPISPFPAIHRDFNFVTDEATRWAELDGVVRRAGGPLLAEVRFREIFRDPQRDGAGKKRMLLSVTLQSDTHTLTSQEADESCRAIVERCRHDLNAHLVA